MPHGKRSFDTEVWLFAFKVVGLSLLVFGAAVAADITRLIHWFKNLNVG